MTLSANALPYIYGTRLLGNWMLEIAEGFPVSVARQPCCAS
jgi:hypothetical protein